MKILIGHNTYRHRGGEDVVVETEVKLLRDKGHQVRLYRRSNIELEENSPAARISAFSNFNYSDKTCREIRALIKDFRPDVAHFHNIFFMITPAAFYALKKEGVPVIVSLHNFRLLCANGLFYRDGHVCEDCLGRTRWQAVVHRCYKNSVFFSGLVVQMLNHHWGKKTWQNQVNLFITATEFTKKKYIEAGIDSEKIVVKPNFLYPESENTGRDEGFALYVGRLSQEKGLMTLVEAWREVGNFPLKIMGEGPQESDLRKYVLKYGINNVEFLGFVDKDEYLKQMKSASFIVVPSHCYENFPRVVAEAFSFGMPVIASRLGSLAEIIKDQETGLFFEPQNAFDLADKSRMLIDREDMRQEMRVNAYRFYQETLSSNRNYELLMSIYERAKKQEQHAGV